MLSLSDNNQDDVLVFNSTSRYLDDLLKIDNPNFEQDSSLRDSHIPRRSHDLGM